MALPPAFEDAWGAAPAPVAPGDILRDAMRKEGLVKEIAAAQDDLRALLARVTVVQKEVDKLTSGNETLQMYVDTLAKQVAASKK